MREYLQTIVLNVTLLTTVILSACAGNNQRTFDRLSSPYDTTAPDITEWMAEPTILVFSKTRGWRHNEGIAGADRFFADLSIDKGYGFFTTENGAIFNADDLARFDVIIFNNMTGDTLSPNQRKAFKNWLTAGGAWIGLHGSGDDSHTSWPWYDKTLIGPEFIGHPADPQLQNAKLVTVNADHPVMENIPTQWETIDEWYSFDSRPQDHGLTPLIGLNETSYSPNNEVYGDVSDLRMGTSPIDHPVVWVGTVGKGRIFYSAMGHSHTSYDHPVNRALLANAFDWVTQPQELLDR